MSVDHSLYPFEVAPYAYRQDYSQSDPNFESFVSNLQTTSDKLVVFLGAGASVGARNMSAEPLPTAYHLRNQIWQRFMLDEKNKSFDYSQLGMMSLEHAAALAETKCGPLAIADFVNSCFMTEKSLWTHAVLKFLKPKAVFTTNYDCLIEDGWRTFAQHQRPALTPVSTPTTATINFTPLYKPHGTVQPIPNNGQLPGPGAGGLVLTQFDYLEMHHSRMRLLHSFLNLHANDCVVFVGYSFFDSDIGAVIYGLRKVNRGRKWYAVFPRNDAKVRELYHDKFGVDHISRTFFEFIYDLDLREPFVPAQYKLENVLAANDPPIQQWPNVPIDPKLNNRTQAPANS